MKNLICRALLAASATVLAAHATAAPTPIVNNDGDLTGANGVNVEGKLYNVEFVDGSCDALFDNCSASAFAFNTRESATAAAQALLDQVFLDGPTGQFDSTPEKTFGCTSAQCLTFIPYSIELGPTFAAAYSVNSGNLFGSDSTGWINMFRADDFRVNASAFNYARFQLAQASDVPEPGSLGLIGLGIAALASRRVRAGRS